MHRQAESRRRACCRPLDRLARSTRDLLNVLAEVAEKGAAFRSILDAWADTTTPHGRLMLTILGGLAEFERELIRTRTGEGRTRAKARGSSSAGKPKLTPDQQAYVARLKADGESCSHIARIMGVSKAPSGASGRLECTRSGSGLR